MPLAPTPRPAFKIRPEDPEAPGVAALLRAGEAHMAALYPIESNHMLSLDALRGPGVVLLVARDDADAAVATGAVSLSGDWAEIKRMWVDPTLRGVGLARALLAELERLACGRGARVARLETGVSSLEARALYESAGYRLRGPFAAYRDDPLSVFMEKILDAGAAP